MAGAGDGGVGLVGVVCFLLFLLAGVLVLAPDGFFRSLSSFGTLFASRY